MVSKPCFVAAVLVVSVLTQESLGQDAGTGQCCGSCVPGPQGPSGIPGNNGFPGNNGVPGNPGRDGTKGDQGEQGPPGGNGTKGDRGELGPPGGDGAKGDRGDQGPAGGDGAKGDRGVQGPAGGDGAKGDRGDQGPPGGNGTKGDRGELGPPGGDGAKGDQGEPGPAGATGSPGTSATRNVKQCTWDNLSSQAASGVIVECPFNKSSPTSALRLTWNGATRIINWANTPCCKRWFLTLNGTECTDPAPIDGIMYMHNRVEDGYVNVHRATTIDGLCYGEPAGPVTVALNVGPCTHDGLDEGSAHTGYNSYSRIIVEELDI
ncbi:uncharacterized protein LOC144927355 [Branchiostoma floridae x Branchiostoma belcheri]